ncbi:MAG: galactokinase [Candidatus Hydrogenedentes bacterium]|nr:galactokinase [Candidatus Hydrogenedentota bacterium]
MSIALETVRAGFARRFGGPASIVARAPGRVNLIGEHTDYNHGFVLPMALDLEVMIAGQARTDNRVRAFAEQFNDSADLPLDGLTREAEHPWMDYIAGVAQQLTQGGYRLPQGADLYITGDVPVGAGLSSSAAVEMAVLKLFEGLYGFTLDDGEAARLGQRVENEFLGISSGIMDQFASRCCRAGHALFLDCRSLALEHVAINFADAALVITDTCCARRLSGSKYNERVAECERAVAGLCEMLGKRGGGGDPQSAPWRGQETGHNRETGHNGETDHNKGTHLRDFSLAALEEARDRLDTVAFRRARHVISENGRTLEACARLRDGDAPGFGALMNASDHSLREDYEVTSPELDAMTAIARLLPGCYGSRMTGAGFGGCAVHLVQTEHIKQFSIRLMEDYQLATGIEGRLYSSGASAGAEWAKV